MFRGSRFRGLGIFVSMSYKTGQKAGSRNGRQTDTGTDDQQNLKP